MGPSFFEVILTGAAGGAVIGAAIWLVRTVVQKMQKP